MVIVTGTGCQVHSETEELVKCMYIRYINLEFPVSQCKPFEWGFFKKKVLEKKHKTGTASLGSQALISGHNSNEECSHAGGTMTFSDS